MRWPLRTCESAPRERDGEGTAPAASEALVVIEDDDSGYETVWVMVDGRAVRGRVLRLSGGCDHRGAEEGAIEVRTRSGLTLRRRGAVSPLGPAWPFAVDAEQLARKAEEARQMAQEIEAMRGDLDA